MPEYSFVLNRDLFIKSLQNDIASFQQKNEKKK